MDPLDNVRQQLSVAYFGSQPQGEKASPLIDLLLKFLPVVLAACGMTPKAGVRKAKNHPRLAKLGVGIQLAEQGVADPSRAADAIIAVAAKTNELDADAIVQAIAAQV